MSTKRTHHKSRKGCRTCRARRVKCDEHHPVCGNCAKRQPGLSRCDFESVSYEYSNDINSAARSPMALATPESLSNVRDLHTDSSSLGQQNHMPTVSYGSLDLADSFQRRSIDCYLFSQWIKSTSLTLSRARHPEALTFWRDEVTHLACKFEYLLDAVLGISALHLWYLDRVANASMDSLANQLLANSTAKHSLALDRLNRDTSPSLLAAAILCAHQLKFRRQWASFEEPYALPIKLFELQNGIAVTFRASLPHLDGMDTVVLRAIFDRRPMLYEKGVNLQELGFLVGDTRADAKTIIDVIHSYDRPQSEQEILRHTWSYILSVEFGRTSHEPFDFTARRIGGLPMLAHPEFDTLLKRHDPVAMGILARFYAFMKPLSDGDWWTKGMADYEVAGIETLMPTHMMWIMEYPRRLLEKFGEQRTEN